MRPEIDDSELGPRARGATATMLKSLLGELDEILASKGIPVEDWLNPGLDSQTITLKLTEHNLGAPKELLALYGWHNGYASNLGARSVPRFPFDPLDTALSTYQMVTNILEEEVRQSGQDIHSFDWGAPPGYLSLTSGQYNIAVNCQADPSEPVQIHFTFPEFWETPNLGRAVSLCTLVTWWIEGIETGAHVWDTSLQDWQTHQDLLPDLQRGRFLV